MKRSVAAVALRQGVRDIPEPQGPVADSILGSVVVLMFLSEYSKGIAFLFMPKSR